ncbi:hypothetical protein [Acinetobacter stercoris]|uniref:WG repeat-containing protein n=1 Tax=Acinetobacter stercoris TaxID=2126983 RepID=A0A2U3N4D0_9GAMM|nr:MULTISPECIES: hypothetical protein [Acinetobacter]SPL72540.1 hypothetical protein KPC_3718 [Acinetobacter stercoris]
MKKKVVIINALLLSLVTCFANAERLQVDDKQLDNLVKCDGVNTEYSNIDGYYTIPDFGCIYDGKNNKLGNAMVFLITSNLGEESISLKNINNIKEKYIYLIPFHYLVKNKNADVLYYEKDKYIYEVYVNNGRKWERKNDVIVNGNSVEVVNNIHDFMSKRSVLFTNAEAKVFQKYKFDVNKDGVIDFINVNKKGNGLSSISIIDGQTKHMLYENKEIFNPSFTECVYSSFDNISISKNNFTLEYTTCSDSSEIGHRYSTFKTEENKEPVLIQDNYLIYPQGELPPKYKPKKVNCMSNQIIRFSNYAGRCG